MLLCSVLCVFHWESGLRAQDVGTIRVLRGNNYSVMVPHSLREAAPVQPPVVTPSLKQTAGDEVSDSQKQLTAGAQSPFATKQSSVEVELPSPPGLSPLVSSPFAWPDESESDVIPRSTVLESDNSARPLFPVVRFEEQDSDSFHAKQWTSLKRPSLESKLSVVRPGISVSTTESLLVESEQPIQLQVTVPIDAVSEPDEPSTLDVVGDVDVTAEVINEPQVEPQIQAEAEPESIRQTELVEIPTDIVLPELSIEHHLADEAVAPMPTVIVQPAVERNRSELTWNNTWPMVATFGLGFLLATAVVLISSRGQIQKIPDVIQLVVQADDLLEKLSSTGRFVIGHSVSAASGSNDLQTAVVDLGDCPDVIPIALGKTFVQRQAEEEEIRKMRSEEICKALFEDNLKWQSSSISA